MDLRLVEYFVAVAEELHFGRAAERLHIAQPSLSHEIRQLERRLGVTLLERTSRRVELTPAGQALLSEGRRLLRQAQRALQITRAAGSERLTIGFYGTAASTLLPELLRAFSEQHPSVELSARELLLGRLDEILAGNVDIAFTRLRPGQTDTELEIELLGSEPRVVALASTHPLADRGSVTFADLRAESFITNPATPAEGKPIRWLVEQQRHGLPGRVVAEAASVQEILTLVSTGKGVCLVPASVSRHYPRADVRYVPVTDAEPAVVSLAWPRGSRRPALDAFIDTARRIGSSSLTPGHAGAGPVPGTHP